MRLSKDFWKAYSGQVLVSSDGKIAFTRAGRALLAERMARHGVSISRVRTLDELQQVTAWIAQVGLEENNAVLRAMLHDPSATDEERVLIRKILSIG